MKELAEQTNDELFALYEEKKMIKDEIAYFKDYLLFVSPMIDLNQPQTRNNININIGSTAVPIIGTPEKLSPKEKIKILKKMEELAEYKYHASGLDKQIQQLECDKLAHDQIVEILFAKRVEEDTDGCGEVIMKNLNAETKRRNNVIDNLTLQKTSLLKHLTKAQKTLGETDGEMGRSIMDYHSLCIENGEYQRTISQLNAQVSKGKNDTGRLISKLNTVKNQLSNVSKEFGDTMSDLSNKTRIEDKLKQEIEELEGHLTELQVEVDGIKQLMEDYETPDVFEYITCCQTLRQLEKTKKQYEHKLSLISNTRSGSKTTSRE